jgi:hypothetical protein
MKWTPELKLLSPEAHRIHLAFCALNETVYPLDVSVGHVPKDVQEKTVTSSPANMQLADSATDMLQ